MSQSGNNERVEPHPAQENAPERKQKDRHFPNIAFDFPFRKLIDSPEKFNLYVSPGQIVADLGCGPGFYTCALAERVGPEGRVYAVDTSEKAIRALEKKVIKKGLRNIVYSVTSAADLSFIPDRSVDFVLASGLLCFVDPLDREKVINEIKRILKVSGKAHFDLTKGFPGFVMDEETWENILSGFTVEERYMEVFNYVYNALVSLKSAEES